MDGDELVITPFAGFLKMTFMRTTSAQWGDENAGDGEDHHSA